jgi:hypothetical protein
VEDAHKHVHRDHSTQHGAVRCGRAQEFMRVPAKDVRDRRHKHEGRSCPSVITRERPLYGPEIRTTRSRGTSLHIRIVTLDLPICR